MPRTFVCLSAAGLTLALLASCAAPSGSPGLPQQSGAASPSAAPSDGIGVVVPAPGSSSSIYPANPAAIVVAIDPGHGGCLDWGVPDPRKRGPAYAEKAMNLAIALELRRLLVAQGIAVVLTRSTDALLAGDEDPDLGCHGDPFRDVDGDGMTGFQAGGRARTHDELQARIDLANLARADLLISIHINSLAQDGVTFQIAATQTFYNDQTAWGAAAGSRLAGLVQQRVVAAIAPLAAYERQDRGYQASDYYLLTPPLFTPTSDHPDPAAQPARGLLLPAVLGEVGSINLPAEHDLLLSPAGQSAVAAGLAAAIADFLADRALAVRYDAIVDGGSAGTVPGAAPGSGPPYWLMPVRGAVLADGLEVRLTNTGSAAWPSGMLLLLGWEASDEPYLRRAPANLTPLAITVPALLPGESVLLLLPVARPTNAPRSIAWITLASGDDSLAAIGSSPLQIAVSP